MSDYSKLRDSSKYENTRVYVSPKFDKSLLAVSGKIKIEPFEIWIRQENIQSFNPDRLVELSQYFHGELTRGLQSSYQIMDVADKDTVTIRGAFTNVKLQTPSMSATDFIPIRLIINAGNSAYLQMTDQQNLVGQLAIEAEFLMGLDNEPTFMMIATKSLESTVSEDVEGNSKALENVLKVWADNFVTEIGKL